MSNRGPAFQGGRGHGKVKFGNPRQEIASSIAVAQSRSVIFDRGGAYEFALARAKIRQRFIENECWSYVDPAAAPAIAVAAAVGVPPGGAPPHPAVPAALLENIFGDPQPIANLAAAHLIVADRRLGTETMYDLNEAELWDMDGVMDGDDIQVAVLKNDMERRKEVLKIENSVPDVERGLLAAVVQWDKDKALHEKKQAACMRVFNNSLGPGPLSVIREDLQAMRYRRAWVRLNDHFGLAGGGQANTSQVIKLLSNAVYNPHRSLNAHIDEMIVIAGELPAFGGGAMPADLLREYVLASVEKSGHSKLLADCEYVRRAELTLEQARAIFQTTISKEATELSVEKALRKTKREDRDGLLAEAEIAAAAAGMTLTSSKKARKEKSVKDGATPPVCKHCGKKHSSEKCWSILECKLCGKTGHIGRFCPETTAAEKPVSTKTVSIGGVFAGRK